MDRKKERRVQELARTEGKRKDREEERGGERVGGEKGGMIRVEERGGVEVEWVEKEKGYEEKDDISMYGNEGRKKAR